MSYLVMKQLKHSWGQALSVMLCSDLKGAVGSIRGACTRRDQQVPQKRIQSKAEGAVKTFLESWHGRGSDLRQPRRASSTVIGLTPRVVIFTWVVFKTLHGLMQSGG